MTEFTDQQERSDAFTELLPAYEIEFVASFEDGSEDAYVTYVSATDTPTP